ncbi:MAG TPA: class I SAM-dependent methyltransferase [Anaerolineales bacterium]|nr:class I SAM-dependent methyltransferase [Anaerolineales bacterium]
MEFVNCNHCGNADSKVIQSLPDLLLDRKQVVTTLVRCQNCGLIYQNPRPSIDQMGEHYPPEYDSYAPDPGARRAGRLMRRVLRYGTRKRAQAVLSYQGRGRILDVGCSTGAFLLGMRAYPGWELRGVEISDHAAAIAREQGLDVFTGTLEEASFQDGEFDAVTLWDVLEHLHDPAATLREILRILKPGGVLVLRVPNHDSWDARIFGAYWAGLDAPRHMFVFDLRSLRNMLCQAGFEDIKMRSNIGGYPTFVLSVRFWLTARNFDSGQQARVVKWLLSPAARILTAPLFFLTGLGLRGPQVTVRCRKQVSF